MSTSSNPSSVVPSPWTSLRDGTQLADGSIVLCPDRVVAESIYTKIRNGTPSYDPQVLFSHVWQAWMVICVPDRPGRAHAS
jgi:hypothetical protein